MFGLNFSGNTDAIDLLKADHADVDAMFKEYDAIKDTRRDKAKADLVEQICAALSRHATIEEEIFYPAVRKDAATNALVNEAAVEHQTLKDIMGRLRSATPADPLYDAGVKVLAEYVTHHVKEEENELFPQVRKMDIDLELLGARLKTRKDELLGGETTPTSARASSPGNGRQASAT
jgi:hemerythrin superfamily protein